MRILVNYDDREKNYLVILQHYIKNLGLQAIATSLTLTPSELVAKAKAASCEAIFLVNEGTLANCVPGTKPTLDAFRGSVLRFSIPTVVGNSLAHINSIDYGAWLLTKDLKKLQTANKPPVPFSFSVLETSSEMIHARNWLSTCVLIAYDIETKTVNEIEDDREGVNEGGDTLITCCSWTGLSRSGEMKSFVLPLIDFNEDHFPRDEDYQQAILCMRSINALPIPKVMHNGMYDSLHSIVYNAEPLHWTLDTMAMAHSEFSSLPKSLDFVASITLSDYVQWSQEAHEASKNKDIHKYWTYNAKDTWHTLRICIHYLKHLPAYARTNYSHLFKFVYPSLYCAFEGILLDQDKRKELRIESQEKLVPALDKLRKMVADPAFNPASPKQVQHYIYDIFGAADPHIGSKKKDGKKVRNTRASDEKNLKAISEQHPILLRFITAMLEYRGEAKAISTYFDFKQKNGRVLYNLNPFGTDTGRMSCASSSFWCGAQVQNIPGYAKKMLIADPGFILMEADNSQSEARCTAYLSEETELMKALETPGRDFYTTLGTLFFQIPYELVTKPFRNKILKKIVHGTNYMMGAVTFIENAGAQNLIEGAAPLNLHITLAKIPKKGEITLKAFANQLLEAYHVPFKKVREWYKKVVTEISTTHMLRSPFGYTRYFFGDILKNHNLVRSAVAHGPQNLSVAIVNIGFWKVWCLVKQNPRDLRLKAQIHDSIFTQIREERKEELQQKVLEAMDNPVVVYGRTLKIPVDYKTAYTWGDMKD